MIRYSFEDLTKVLIEENKKGGYSCSCKKDPRFRFDIWIQDGIKEGVKEIYTSFPTINHLFIYPLEIGEKTSESELLRKILFETIERQRKKSFDEFFTKGFLFRIPENL